jgi:hypothetical protein
MKNRNVAILTSLLLASPAWSQEPTTFRLHCQILGPSVPEPLGDREGHSLSTTQVSCRAEGGPMDGAVMSGYTAYEWQGQNANGVGFGVIRKRGAALVYSNSEMTSSLIMENGRVVGNTGGGRGRYVMASGAASAWAGKGYRYTFKSSGFNQFTIDVTVD